MSVHLACYNRGWVVYVLLHMFDGFTPFSVDNTQTVVVHVLPLWLTYKSKCETRVVHVLL